MNLLRILRSAAPAIGTAFGSPTPGRDDLAPVGGTVTQDTKARRSHAMPEKVVIIGSGPAAWTAAIYAARATLNPLVFQGNPDDDRNRQNGTLPLGQLALTTEVENFPSWPAGDTRQYLKTALPADDPDFPYWVSADKPQPTHGINGPELVALMRQQAKNFGTRVESKDVVKVELKNRPFTVTTHDGQTVQTLTLIVATGARANYLGLPSEDKYK